MCMPCLLLVLGKLARGTWMNVVGIHPSEWRTSVSSSIGSVSLRNRKQERAYGTWLFAFASSCGFSFVFGVGIAKKSLTIPYLA